MIIRRTTLLAALLLGACGDESDPKPRDAGDMQTLDAGKDAGSASSADSGPPEAPVTPNIVTNVGTACRAANACMGEKPSCQTMLSLLGQEIPFPGGYCSAPCADSRECGETGECPVGESLKDIPVGLRSLLGGAAPSHCYERCTRDTDCRTSENYRCASIYTALTEGAGAAGLSIAGFDISAFLMGPIKDSKYCLPPAPAVPDAGPAIIDAGPAGNDAAVSDAGSNDAGNL